MNKSKLPLPSDSVALRQLSPIHKIGHKVFLKKIPQRRQLLIVFQWWQI